MVRSLGIGLMDIGRDRHEKSVSCDRKVEVKAIDYFAFEYSVLLRLQEIFSIKDFNMDQNIFYAKRPMQDEFGNLHDTTVARFVNEEYIQFNFIDNFYVKFSRDCLIKAFEEKCEVEEVVRKLRDYIELQWLKRIYAK